MITLEKFLEQMVTGYLLHDLKNMNDIQLENGETNGAAGYPMIGAVNAGIELLGALLSDSSYSRERGRFYFYDYWGKILGSYDQKYLRLNLDKLVYNLVRHGIAHFYATKIGIVVTKKNPGHHLTSDSKSSLVIDASQYYLDFDRSYRAIFLPIVSTKKNLMQERLNEIIEVYEKDSKEYFQQLGNGTSMVGTVSQGIFSTNTTTSTKGFSGPWQQSPDTYTYLPPHKI